MSKPLPKKITLWHGSPVQNAPSILRHGIRYREVDSKKKISEASKEIGRTLDVKGFEQNGFIEDRMSEAKEHGGVVYFSADKAYAMGNALAGLEWYQNLIANALDKKFKPLYERRRKLASKELRLLGRLKESDTQVRKALNSGNYEEYGKLAEQSKKIEERYRKVQEKTREMSNVIQDMEKVERSKFLSRKAVLFKVELPWSEFKRLAVGDFSKGRIEQFEKLWLEGHFEKHPLWKKTYKNEKVDPFARFFDEVHLREVSPQYIKSVGFFEHRRLSTEYPKVSMKPTRDVVYV